MKIDRCPFTADEKNRMIAQAAYYRYEKRGRGDGDSTKDWREAESEIKKQINEFCLPTPRKLGEFIPKAIKKVGRIAWQGIDVSGEELGRKLGNFRAKRVGLANIWSGKGDHLFSHASQNIKSWVNRQHGNGK